MKLPSKACIVCGRPVPRWQEDKTVRPTDGRSVGGHWSNADIVADLRTKADCLRYTNLPHIVSVMRSADTGLISRFTVWDGESYFNQGYFCTNRCAMSQGLASAQHGHRYTWKRS